MDRIAGDKSTALKRKRPEDETRNPMTAKELGNQINAQGEQAKKIAESYIGLDNETKKSLDTFITNIQKQTDEDLPNTQASPIRFTNYQEVINQALNTIYGNASKVEHILDLLLKPGNNEDIKRYLSEEMGSGSLGEDDASQHKRAKLDQSGDSMKSSQEIHYQEMKAGEEEDTPNLQDHFNIYKAKIDDLLDKIEKLPEKIKQQFDEHKLEYQRLQQTFTDISTDSGYFTGRTVNDPEPHLQTTEKGTRDTNEDIMRKAVNEIGQLHQNLNNQVQEATITQLRDIIQTRYTTHAQISEMKVMEQRPEWQKQIKTFLKNYKGFVTQIDKLVQIETEIMYDTLIPKESTYLCDRIRKAEGEELMKFRPIVDEWLKTLPNEYKEKQTEIMYDTLIDEQRTYLCNRIIKAEGEELMKFRPIVDEWLETLSDECKEKQSKFIYGILIEEQRTYLGDCIEEDEGEELMKFRPIVDEWLETLSDKDKKEHSRFINDKLIPKECDYLCDCIDKAKGEEIMSFRPIVKKLLEGLSDGIRKHVYFSVNNRLMFKERDYLYDCIDKTEGEEIMSFRPIVDEWLESLPNEILSDKFIKNNAKEINDRLTRKEILYMKSKTIGMKRKNQQSEWEKYIETLPEDMKLPMTEYMNDEILGKPNPYLFL